MYILTLAREGLLDQRSNCQSKEILQSIKIETQILYNMHNIQLLQMHEIHRNSKFTIAYYKLIERGLKSALEIGINRKLICSNRLICINLLRKLSISEESISSKIYLGRE